ARPSEAAERPLGPAARHRCVLAPHRGRIGLRGVRVLYL
ncbi:hypothetical protein, partial [Arthrobacter sp. DR-2P]